MAGGDRLFVCFPPAEGSLPVGERQLRCGGRSSEDRLRLVAQLREENVGRRRLRCRRPNSGEAAVVGDNRLFGPLPPAKEITILLTENSPLLFNRHSSGLF